jgi:hypothetical protein
MYNFYLEKLSKERTREQELRSRAEEKRQSAHQHKTEILKKRYWNRIENFMYNVA